MAALFVASACTRADQGVGPRPAGDPGYGQPRVVGRVQDPALGELSGLATSSRGRRVMWAHNDSGGDPILYCLDRTGASCGTWEVTGADAVDWEDIAAAPGPRGPSLYIADIGDNSRERRRVVIYLVPEPRPGGDPAGGIVEATATELRYPDRPHDAEAVIVDRASGDLYVVTKEYSTRAAVFVARAPLRPRMTFERVTRLDLSGPAEVVTGASLSPDGDRLILSTYGKGQEFRVPEGDDFEDVWKQRSLRVVLGPPAQREAVTYLDDETIVTIGEGALAPIYAIERRR